MAVWRLDTVSWGRRVPARRLDQVSRGAGLSNGGVRRREAGAEGGEGGRPGIGLTVAVQVPRRPSPARSWSRRPQQERTVELSSAREVKATILSQVLGPLTAPGGLRPFGVAAQSMKAMDRMHRSIAIGIAAREGAGFRLAVRLQRAELYKGEHVEAMRRAARGELDVVFVGPLQKRQGTATPWYQSRNRPLRIGSSIAHFHVTAGTLGCFVKDREGGATRLILSNNHVLADENQAALGDPILQPGPYDHGSNPADAVGALVRFVQLRTATSNVVDCAISSVNAGIEIDAKTLTGIGALNGLGALPTGGVPVAKVGRTSGVTRGLVTAFELDNVVVEYDIGDLRFDNQIEIEGQGNDPFSAGGDSGSLIVNEQNQAIALLFAGGDLGGSNGRGLTYANPLLPVHDQR